MAKIKLIVGLGNPGAEYARTRHNAGFWLVDALAAQAGVALRLEAKFHGLSAKCHLHGQECYLLQPQTFMNASGRAVQAMMQFYKIQADEILVVHDELDLPCGVAKMKWGGGHGGHNGLRDIAAKLGTGDYWRLRLGIDHPGHKAEVVNYVLKPAGRDEQIALDLAIDKVLGVMPAVLSGDMNTAMLKLHTV